MRTAARIKRNRRSESGRYRSVRWFLSASGGLIPVRTTRRSGLYP